MVKKIQQTNKNDKRNQNNCILVHLNLIENPVVHFFAAFSRSITQTSMYLRSQVVISHLRLVILQSLVKIYKPFMIRPINSYFFKILLAILQAGIGGDVILKPGAGGTVIIAGTDLRKFIEVFSITFNSIKQIHSFFCKCTLRSLT